LNKKKRPKRKSSSSYSFESIHTELNIYFGSRKKTTLIGNDNMVIIKVSTNANDSLVSKKPTNENQ